MKNNISLFYVGQKVVYIGKSENGLTKNSNHVVVAVYKQPCGCWAVDISQFKHKIFNDPFETICGYCHKSLGNSSFGMSQSNGETYISHIELKPIQELKVPVLTFEKIKEEEKEEILILN